MLLINFSLVNFARFCHEIKYNYSALFDYVFKRAHHMRGTDYF